MRCAEVMAKSTAYLEGEVSPEQGSALRGHLRQCESCRHALLEESVIRDGLKKFDAEMDPPKALWTNIQARLAQHEIADAGRSGFWQMFLIVGRQAPLWGGALAAALAVWWVWPEGKTAVAPAPSVSAPVESAAPAATRSIEEMQTDERVSARQAYAEALAEVEELRGGARIPLRASEQATALGTDFVLKAELSALATQRTALDREMRAVLLAEVKP
jgi:hypothetical protein